MPLFPGLTSTTIKQLYNFWFQPKNFFVAKIALKDEMSRLCCITRDAIEKLQAKKTSLKTGLLNLLK